MIEIMLTAGLCNRMRALDSALALGRAANVPVRAIWKLGSDLNCPFEELFKAIPGLERVDNVAVRPSSPRNAIGALRSIARKIRPLIYIVKKSKSARRTVQNLSASVLTIEHEGMDSYHDRPEALTALASQHDLRIDTFSRFFRGTEDYIGFQPRDELMERVEEFSLKTQNAVGVHIRTSDYDPYRTHGPMAKYLSAMRLLNESDPSIVFFIASNSKPIEEQIEREFPQSIIRQRQKSYARDDPDGARHALVDLYCLASCKRLLGSNHSSFTDTASELGRIPCEVF